MAKIVVRQTRSLIGNPTEARKVVRALGLGRIGKTKVHKDNNCIRGMINKVRHLVEIDADSYSPEVWNSITKWFIEQLIGDGEGSK